MALDVFDKINFNIQKDIDSISELVSRGNCKDMEHYRSSTGHLFGLMAAQDIVNAVKAEFYGDEEGEK